MFPQWIKIRAETWIETSEVTIIIQIDIALILNVCVSICTFAVSFFDF